MNTQEAFGLAAQLKKQVDLLDAGEPSFENSYLEGLTRSAAEMSREHARTTTALDGLARLLDPTGRRPRVTADGNLGYVNQYGVRING